jgi:prepilin signal peptidase PulO-like enzyme (type II secretory pathway)
MFLRKKIGEVPRKIINAKISNAQFNTLKQRYFISKIFNGSIFGLIGVFLYLGLGFKENALTLIFAYIFMYLLQLSAVIDAKYWIIPDVITLPMLACGVFIQKYWAETGIENILTISPLFSIISILAVYSLCTISALFFYVKNPNSFGGGDVKLLSAVAGFSGAVQIGYMVVFAGVLMGVWCAAERRRSAPLAPFVFCAFLLWLAARKFAII